MKLADKTVEVTSNITFDETMAMGIDESAIALVIERLISTYSNPYRAALREYTSNAYDEHVASGQTLPVEVSLPNALSPILKVQDFGRGLTRDELKGFGTIGTSTKRDSNDFTGGFGLGTKTGLAAASQFTVVSVKNGVRNTVIVARDEQNRPHMNFLAEIETDDPSGTTVIVPISDASKFGDLTDFFVGWTPGSILIDGEEPARSVYNSEDFKTISGGLAYSDKKNISAGRDSIRLLINQVYYVLDYKNLGLTYKQWDILKYYVIRIDNGSVDIAPSREDLLYNARTKASLEARFNEILTVSSRIYAEGVREADSLVSALKLRDQMKTLGLPLDGLKWGNVGLVLPGDTVNGNKVPDPEGTWASPSKDPKTRLGFRVEKQWGAMSKRALWRGYDSSARVMIVHSAGEVVKYGRYNDRKMHREAASVGEYLYGVDGNSSWSIFFTSEPESRINRIYRDLADSVISADEFNAVVAKVKAEFRAEDRKSRTPSVAATQKLRALLSFDVYYGVSIKEYTPAELADSGHEYVIPLRNQIGGLEERVRHAISTKVGYDRQIMETVNLLRRSYNAVTVLLPKSTNLEELAEVVPNLISFEDLSAKYLKDNLKKKSVSELGAARDLEKYSLYAIQRMTPEIIDRIKNKKTREWATAIRDYKDTTASIHSKFSWLQPLDAKIKAILENGSDEKPTLPESRAPYYPLLQHLDYYRMDFSLLADYINLVDSSLKG